MSRPRTIKAHQGLPAGWRYRYGAYRYRVPAGQEAHWDNQKEFRLGATLKEAYLTFAGRLASGPDGIRTFNQLFDRYLLEVTPTKAASTQTQERNYLNKLREYIGENPVELFESIHAYELQNRLLQAVTKGSGETTTNRIMEKLKHTLTLAIQWGVIREHPMTDLKFKMLKAPRKSHIARATSLDQVVMALEHAPKWLQLYCKLKMLTGLRQVDLLLMTQREITNEGLLVTHHKTRESSGKSTLYEWTPELKSVVTDIKRLPPASIHLFKTKHGKMMWDPDRGRESSGFNSAWKRWMSKLQPELRFSERSIRNLVGSEGDLNEAFARLGHSNIATTLKYYRLGPTKASPLRPKAEK